MSSQSQGPTYSRRRFVRAIVPASVLRSDRYRARDLSENGMCLHSPSAVEVGLGVSLQLHIDGEAIDVRGIVRWCRESASALEHGYHFGVEFLDLSTTNQLLLRQYVNALGEAQTSTGTPR